MIRKMSWLALGGLLVAACADPQMDQRVADLEKKVSALETRGGGNGAQRPAANDADEQAGANLLKEASKLAEELKYDEAKKKLDELKEKHPTSRAARASQRLSEELAVVGKPAGDLKVDKWFQGNVASLDSGKATLLVFWEVWCPHCKREVPKLTATYDKYKGRGLQMVGLTKQSRNITDDQVNDFLKDTNVTYPIAKETGEQMSEYFGVRGVPAAAVVKDGKVIWRGHPARLTDQMIEGWL